MAREVLEVTDADTMTTALPSKLEFDPSRAERIAIQALSAEQGRLNDEARGLLSEVAKRLGLDESYRVTFNTQTGKLEAVKVPAAPAPQA